MHVVMGKQDCRAALFGRLVDPFAKTIDSLNLAAGAMQPANAGDFVLRVFQMRGETKGGLHTFVCKRFTVRGPVPGRSRAGSGPRTCQDGSILVRA
jgi:hypothetical protein